MAETALMQICNGKILHSIEETQKHFDSLERYRSIDKVAVEILRVELMAIYDNVQKLEEIDYE